MSYDLHLFKPRQDESLETTAVATLEDGASDVINPGPLRPESEAAKQRLAAALMAENPDLHIYPFDFAAIARSESTSEAEARVRHRHLELNGPEDGPGIQVTLLDQTASVTVPYWHAGADAEPVFAEIWRYLELLEREGGFRTYDPQLARILDLGQDFGAVVEEYLAVADRVQGTSAGRRSGAVARRPWWKFW